MMPTLKQKPAAEFTGAGCLFEWRSERLFDVRQRVVSVLKTALPLFLNLELIALIGLVDVQLAGRIGPAAQAAIGLGDQLLYLTCTLASGLSVAVCALVSRYSGSKNERRFVSAIQASLIVATAGGAIAVMMAFFYGGDFIKLFTEDPQVIAAGSRYIKYCAPASLPFVLSIIVSSVLRCSGKTKHSILSWLTTSFFTIIFSFAFFELDKLPFIGGNQLKGSLDALCLAWNIGACLGLVVGLAVLRRQTAHLPRVRTEIRTIERLAKLLVVIGSAIAFAESSTFIADFLIYKLIEGMPAATEMQAAWTVYLKIEETLAIMPLSAVSTALAALVGLWRGRAEETRTRQGVIATAALVVVLSTWLGLVILILPQTVLVSLASESPVSEGAGVLILLLPIFLPLLALRLIFFAYLEGCGRTAAPMKLSIAGNVLKLTAALFLGNFWQLGLTGVAVALLLSRIYLALGAIQAFLRSGKVFSKQKELAVQSCQRISVSSSSS